MNTQFQLLMRDATRLTQAGRLNEATEAIQRALEGMAAAAGMPSHTVDGEAFEVNELPSGLLGTAQPAVRPDASARQTSCFSDERFVHGGMALQYKLYQPAGRSGEALPLVVMLHGCTQNPDDFAAGTGMNALADELGFVVLYPAQSQAANPQGCWNWFEHSHQKRGSGEPAALAALTLSVIKAYGIDARRVYVAGLSAGGAMADIVANAYPDIFAAAGVHSGLPCGAAGSVAEAFAAMSGGSPDASPLKGVMKKRRGAAQPEVRAVPTIVFHGDRDHTVHPRNGEQVIAAALGRVAGQPERRRTHTQQGMSEKGRHYTRIVHDDHDGAALAEHWVVHGAGHAWSGGQAAGSYTDAGGPDATREMLRFFLAQALAPGA
ncbi:esterase, PHB depolymerase family protein [Methyloversatilis sp. RAC08]|uniref:extracellular catalytic domain type 1 short-chain-length polyhydroxyalkanoate depolymerase n=1 Tax=Methyloversatilis sp. RAC08 TaxID=1842540 RepID=UPI00083E1B0F|nr:PHB depolymerase family esterase [Methyloversatilis sp. RAC08]AOF81597.1 esterase, PHB depolymerase family protein [Methyloversatilis sp. RAC08]